jgi:hypothetical protein
MKSELMTNSDQPTSHVCLPRRTRVCLMMITLLISGTLAVPAAALDVTITTSFDRNFQEKWNHRIPGRLPVLSSADTTYAGIPLSLQLFFRNYACNYFHIADLSFSYTVAGPDGGVVRDTGGITAFTGVVEGDTGVLLSNAAPEITFTRREKPGVYTLTVTAEDRISRKTTHREKKIILAGYPSVPPDRFDVVSFNVWVHDFCIAPDPGRAVAAFRWFMNSPSSDNDRIFWPVFYFFQSLFHDYPALVDELAATFPNSSARVREYTVLLFRVLEVKRRAVWRIPDGLWKKFDRMKETGYLDPFTLALKSGSVQFLEQGFYCYGRYGMIRFLIGCLGLHTPEGYNAFIRDCRRYGWSTADAIDRSVALRLSDDARMILSKAYPKHRLIRSYCDYAFTFDSLPNDAAAVLGEIVQSTGH